VKLIIINLTVFNNSKGERLVTKMVKTTKPKSTKEVKPPAATKTKGKKLYNVIFFHKWCKSCGLCTALCTKQIIKPDELGLPYIDAMDSCIGCRFCEIHCPDFAITVKLRHPERRLSNGNK
jgi:2-oxoglutarate ferredoxin oxidoreductase subunit delta